MAFKDSYGGGMHEPQPDRTDPGSCCFGSCGRLETRVDGGEAHTAQQRSSPVFAGHSPKVPFLVGLSGA